MANCATPVIIAGAVEGSLHLLVSAPAYTDGTTVYFSDEVTGSVADELALIALPYPLKANQTISVYISDTNCKVSSCIINTVSVEPYMAECIAGNCPSDGIPTGYLVCDGIDLKHEVHDGNCGYRAGELLLADCRYCGGTKPNCDEEEE